jgi:drug/metabolite transporter (DMT)-like permease
MLIKLMPHFGRNTATLIGLTAVLFWSSNVGLIRSVCESFGAIGGVALIYTVAAIILFFTIGLPKLSSVPKPYLMWGSLLFVAYEVCFAISIGYAQNGRQTIEVGMVNYLWPTFTMVFAIIFNRVPSNGWIIPGTLMALCGICLVLAGDQGFDFQGMWKNILLNPLSYGLAFVAAIIWAAYCSVTVKLSSGKNIVTLFFILTAIVLWFKYLWMGQATIQFNESNTIILLFAAGALGLGYGAWNIGILNGNITLLAGASYFTPVLSAVFASIVLNTSLSMSFWYGVAMVTGGAILCWLATRQKQHKL